MAGAPDSEAGEGYVPFLYRSRDGLTLYGRDYRADATGALPVVCLPGLTRSSRDFHELALTLSRGPKGRRVVALDFRGRGRSQYDPTGASYQPPVEAQDVLDGLADRRIARAVFVGTSRGGIVTMLLGSMAPGLIAAAVLNDIGSVIETAGLLNIKSYIGVEPGRIGWEEAAGRLATTFGAEFPAFDAEDWRRQARLTFADRDGLPALDYDLKLADGFRDITPTLPPIHLEAAFASLATAPVLVLRGEMSRLLAAETVAAMRASHPHLESLVVAGQGHPPALRGEVASSIAAFLDRIDPVLV